METKIPFYNIVNIFLTGLVFSVIYVFIYHNFLIRFINNHVGITKFCLNFEFIACIIILGIIYEIGLIINRLSSVVIESLLLKLGIVKFDDYSKFNNCKKEYPILSVLSREYAVARSSFTLWILISLLFFTKCYCFMTMVSFVISLIFLLSCIKMSGKINDIIGSYKEK